MNIVAVWGGNSLHSVNHFDCDMEGLTEINKTSEAFGLIEKDLDSPIMKDVNNQSEDIDIPKDMADKEILPQDELNRPLSTYSEIGLSDEVKQEVLLETGWSENVVDYLRSTDEMLVYKEANLIEVNGNLERTDIDWTAKIPQDKIDRMRSIYGDEVADKWANKTNMDLIKEGKAPYGPDGEQVNLHHVGQKSDSPLAELTYTEHKQNDGILHDKSKTSEIERPVFQSERKHYWQARYEALQQK